MRAAWDGYRAILNGRRPIHAAGNGLRSLRRGPILPGARAAHRRVGRQPEDRCPADSPSSWMTFARMNRSPSGMRSRSSSIICK